MNWRQDAPTAAAAASTGASASPPTTDADPLDIFGAGDLDSDSPTDAASAHASHSQSQSPLQDGEAVDVSAGAGSALGGMRPDTPRGRRWHARAATALRNLRPGRRAAEQGAPEVDGTGSRTFLIYVIGGMWIVQLIFHMTDLFRFVRIQGITHLIIASSLESLTTSTRSKHYCK